MGWGGEEGTKKPDDWPGPRRRRKAGGAIRYIHENMLKATMVASEVGTNQEGPHRLQSCGPL